MASVADEFEMVFGDPPEQVREGPFQPVWADRLAPLRQQPGQWARIITGEVGRVYSVRSNILQGAYTGIEPGEFEITVNWSEVHGEYVMAARYVGHLTAEQRSGLPYRRRPPGPARWEKILAPLKQRPGEWGRVFVGNRAQANSRRHCIAYGSYRGVEAGEFEAVTRSLDDGSGNYGVWCRYVGKPKS